MTLSTDASAQDRNTRRKQRTRAALITAARRILAAGDAHSASLQMITDRADVGFGSFYNHFATKEELFAAALAEAEAEYGVWLDGIVGHEHDPVRRLVRSIQATGRLHTTEPELAALLINRAIVRPHDHGLLPERMSTDIRQAIQARSENWSEQRAAVASLTIAGAIASVLAWSATETDAIREDLADHLAADVLRILGDTEEHIAALIEEHPE